MVPPCPHGQRAEGAGHVTRSGCTGSTPLATSLLATLEAVPETERTACHIRADKVPTRDGRPVGLCLLPGMQNRCMGARACIKQKARAHDLHDGVLVCNRLRAGALLLGLKSLWPIDILMPGRLRPERLCAAITAMEVHTFRAVGSVKVWESLQNSTGLVV